MMTTVTKRPVTRDGAGLAEELRTSIARLSRRLRAQSNHGISFPQFAALAAVDRHGSMTPRELADHEKVQPPSMTRTVAALEEQHLLIRQPHPTDGRQVVLTVTEPGRELLRTSRRLKQAWLSQRLEELSPDELTILEQAVPILDKLSKA
jgi:DNA-binding MarR family transcriptional regulator